MTDTLRIKRRTSGGTGPPAILANAELAFNEADNTLYYGRGDSSGMATSVIAIAGDAKVGEAPSDSKIYARRNAGWFEITVGAGGAPYIGDAPPGSPAVGQLWFESDTGNTYIWYADADSSQWVMIASAAGGGGDFVQKIGDTMTGALTLPSDPTQPLQAATKQYVDVYGVPPGAVMTFAMVNPPSGWLKANGAAVSRATYAALFANIGTTYGAGDGSTTFNLPDLRGEFMRGWADDRAVDTGRAIGSAQGEAVNSHTHTWSGTTGGESVDHTHNTSVSGTTGTVSANHTHTFSDASSVTGGVSANHTHAVPGGGSTFPASSGAINIWAQAGGTTGANSVGHTHTVAVSGTTGTISVNHTHTFADASSVSAGRSAGHTHTVSGTTAANNNAGTEVRPRNVALLVCIKY